MKRKYVVYKEAWGTSGKDQYAHKEIKTFRNESEALAFISNDKNIYMHGDMLLKMQDTDGRCYHWDDHKRLWEESTTKADVKGESWWLREHHSEATP